MFLLFAIRLLKLTRLSHKSGSHAAGVVGIIVVDTAVRVHDYEIVVVAGIRRTQQGALYLRNATYIIRDF